MSDSLDRQLVPRLADRDPGPSLEELGTERFVRVKAPLARLQLVLLIALVVGCHGQTPSPTVRSAARMPAADLAAVAAADEPTRLMYGMLVSPEAGVVISPIYEGLRLACEPPPPHRLVAIDLATGVTRWERPAGHEVPIAVMDGALVIAHAGRLAFDRVSLETGQSTACAQTGETPAARPTLPEALVATFSGAQPTFQHYSLLAAGPHCSGAEVPPPDPNAPPDTLTVVTFTPAATCTWSAAVDRADRHAGPGDAWGARLANGIVVRLEDPDDGTIPEPCMHGDASADEACLYHHMLVARRLDGSLLWEREWSREPKDQEAPP